MSVARFFNTHKTWEEWSGMALGAMILLSPWFASQPDHRAVIVNSLVVGILMFGVAQLEYLSLRRWQEASAFVLGVWLIISTFVFDYAGAETLRSWHFVLGALVTALATLELWQDWLLSEKDMAEYGK